jgi:hypothetical protein
MSTGYEGGDSEPFIGIQRWQLNRWASPVHHNVVAILTSWEDEKRTVNGYLNFKDEAEFMWAKSRIEGDRRVDPNTSS